MERRTEAVIVLGAMTLVTGMLIGGHGPWSGRVIWAITGTHGLNSGDIIPLAAWLITAVCCVSLWRGSD